MMMTAAVHVLSPECPSWPRQAVCRQDSGWRSFDSGTLPQGETLLSPVHHHHSWQRVGTGLSTTLKESLGPLSLLDEAMSRPTACQGRSAGPTRYRW
jgi:hypothetical protein